MKGASDHHARCREAIRRLFEHPGIGLEGRMPRLELWGGRDQALKGFVKHLKDAARDQPVFPLVDSEEPVADRERPWEHLRKHDGWERPEGAEDEQVLLMTTCMETWIVADRETLRRTFKSDLKEQRLPDPEAPGLESRDRRDLLGALIAATKQGAFSYEKGERPFQLLGEADPDTLARLPAFERMRRILRERMGLVPTRRY